MEGKPMKKQYTEDETNRAREYLSYYASIAKSFDEHRGEMKYYINEPTFVITNPLADGIHIYNIQIIADVAEVLLYIVNTKDIQYPYKAHFYFRGCKFFGLLDELDFYDMIERGIPYEIVSC